MRFFFFGIFLVLCGYNAISQTFQQRLNPLRLSPGVSNVSLTSDEGFLYSSGYSASITANPGGMNLTKLSRNASIQWSKDYVLNVSPLNGSTVKWEAQNGYLITSFLLDTLQNKQVAFIDSAGNVVWSKRFGADGDINAVNLNSGICVAKVIDDTSFALAGGTGLLANNNGNNDLFLGKMNNQGNLIWSKQICFGCIGNDVDASLQNFIITSDGGFLLCGYINNYSVFPFANGVLLSKLDSQGNLEWSKTYRNTLTFGQSIGYDVKQKPNGNYIIVGQNNDFSLTEGLILEVNTTGNLLNAYHLNIANESHNETIQKLELESNGDFAFAMSTFRDTNSVFSYEWNILAKLDNMYNIKWAYNYEQEPLVGFGPTRFCDMKKSYDNGYAYLLNTAPTTSFTDFYPMLVQTDDQGKTGCETIVQLDVVQNNNYSESINLPTIIPIFQEINIQLNASNFNGLLVSNPTIQLGNDTTICEDVVSIPLVVSNISNTTYLWNTGDTTNSILATSPGVYWVENYNPDNCLRQSDTLVISKSNTFDVNFVLNDSILCEGKSYPLTVGSSQSNLVITWSSGDTSSIINIDSSGTYSFIAENDLGCSVKKDTLIVFNEAPVIGIISVDSVCSPYFITLKASANYPFYQWNTGELQDSIQVDQAGIYSLLVRDQFGCTNSTSKVIVASNSCIDLFMPNAFSPNNDGINDLFRIRGVAKSQFSSYYLKVFDRWGQLVFASSNSEEGWDGNFKGRFCEIGTYYWSLNYQLPLNKSEILKGDINLIR
jgi:gliding motility-associated-like protein